jgi:hypothetical protein
MVLDRDRGDLVHGSSDVLARLVNVPLWSNVRNSKISLLAKRFLLGGPHARRALKKMCRAEVSGEGRMQGSERERLAKDCGQASFFLIKKPGIVGM